MRPALLLLAAAVGAQLLPACGRSHSTANGIVTRVIDGDTIVVAGVGTVRYIGVDTPEMHHPRRPVERLARAAYERNRTLVEGRRVTLVAGREPTDSHGRRLAYVYTGGRFVNAVLVAEGLARTLRVAPNTEHAAELSRLQQRAQAAARGLWSRSEGGPEWGTP